jgi:dihydropteroate synthase
MIGAVTGKPPGERVHGSVAAALLAAQNGAAIVRVHDVAATADALAVLHAVQAQPAAAARPARPAMPRWGDED